MLFLHFIISLYFNGYGEGREGKGRESSSVYIFSCFLLGISISMSCVTFLKNACNIDTESGFMKMCLCVWWDSSEVLSYFCGVAFHFAGQGTTN